MNTESQAPTHVERRRRRSDNPAEAVRLYLDSLLQQEDLEAVALSTEDGLLIAGAGKLDLEWMGALAPVSRRAFFEWDRKTMHVQRFSIDGMPVFLTSAGRQVPTGACAQHLTRILRNGVPHAAAGRGPARAR